MWKGVLQSDFSAILSGWKPFEGDLTVCCSSDGVWDVDSGPTGNVGVIESIGEEDVRWLPKRCQPKTAAAIVFGTSLIADAVAIYEALDC